jgi:plasmid stabilization system protein ParE
MEFQVRLTDEAIADLRGIVQLIAEKSPEAAQRVGGELIAATESLTSLPDRGARVAARRDMRKILRWKYVIYYRVKSSDRVVEVLRIWDGRRAPWSLDL